MKIGDHDWHLEPFGKHIWRGRMEAGQLLALARTVKGEGGQLTALWGSDDRQLGAGFGIHLAFGTSIGLVWADNLHRDALQYLPINPCASRSRPAGATGCFKCAFNAAGQRDGRSRC